MVQPHQSESENDIAREIAAKWVQNPIASDVASEVAFALVWLDHKIGLSVGIQNGPLSTMSGEVIY